MHISVKTRIIYNMYYNWNLSTKHRVQCNAYGIYVFAYVYIAIAAAAADDDDNDYEECIVCVCVGISCRDAYVDR